MRNMIGKYEKHNWSPIKESYNLANNQDQTCICNQPRSAQQNLSRPKQLKKHEAILTNAFSNLDKHICQFREIQFIIKTNAFYNADKYILQLGSEFFLGLSSQPGPDQQPLSLPRHLHSRQSQIKSNDPTKRVFAKLEEDKKKFIWFHLIVIRITWNA